MKIFLLTLMFFLLVIFGMAIGYIIKRRTIKGSCGGIANLGIEKVCDCDKPCAERLKRMQQERS